MKLDPAAIDRIVARARELGPRERLSYVREACGADNTAIEQVLRALSAEERPEHAQEAGDPWSTDRSGQVLWPWKLIRRLGGGGMSEVYLAERCGEFKQLVAVKLVRPGLVSRTDYSRLRSERQILARLSHPNIARLLDGGTTDDGTPYLVMEYVDGVPIDVHCDRNRLTIRERLALFRVVCAAVHAAHQNLVIHRDLKPSNILVTKDGTLKLLDFGIAKLLEPQDAAHTVAITHAHVRVFTPGHASPEQVRGEPVTTATDVYLLGSLLYELLTGRRPFRVNQARYKEIERIICHETPPLPSRVVCPRDPAEMPLAELYAHRRQSTPARLRRELEGDLDNILMMALRKEPSRRYASADELAADIRRYEAGQPVIARRDTWRYRTGKFLRRHAVAVSIAAAFVVLLAAFAATMTIQAHRIAQERSIAEQERRRSDEVARFLIHLFEVADPREARGEQITAREILARGAERIDRELANQPHAQASLMETIGRVYLSLGLTDEARPQIEGSLALRRRLYAGDHPATASSLSALGKLELAEGRLEIARDLLQQSLDMNERLFGREHLAVAASLQHLGEVLKVMGEIDEAEAALRESLRLFSELEGPQSSQVASVMNELAQIMERRGDMAGAEDFYRRALQIDRRVLGDRHPQVAHNLHNLAVVLQAQGDLSGARPLFEESLALLRDVLGEEHPDTLDALGNYGRFLQATGELQRAEEVLRNALATGRKVRGENHPYVGYDHVNLAYLLQAKGDHAGAQREFREALKIYEATLPADHVYIASALTGLALTLIDLGRPEQARETVERALQIWRASLPAEHVQILKAEAVLGRALAVLGRREEAESLLAASHDKLRAALGSSSPQVRLVSGWLAELRNRPGRTVSTAAD